MHKNIIAVVVSLIISFPIIAQTNAKPYKFNFGTIPFGKSIDDVLAMLDEAVVKESDSLSIGVINYYGITDYFPGGLYTMMGFGCYFNSSVAKKFTVKYNDDGNVKEVNLFFTKDFGKENYTLFLVHKTLKSSDGGYESVFSGIKDSITKSLKVNPKVTAVKFQTDSMRANYTYEPALVGVWILSAQKVYLLVRNNFLILSSDDPEILYVSNTGWNKYIAACQAKKADRERKEREESASTADDF